MFQLKYYKLSKYFSHDLTSNILYTKKDKFSSKYLKLFYRRKFFRLKRQVRFLPVYNTIYNQRRKKWIPAYSIFLYNQKSASLVRFRRRILDNYIFLLQCKKYFYSNFLIFFHSFFTGAHLSNSFLFLFKRRYQHFFFLDSNAFLFKYNFISVHKLYVCFYLLRFFKLMLFYKKIYKRKIKYKKKKKIYLYNLRYLFLVCIFFFFFSSRYISYNFNLCNFSKNWENFFFLLKNMKFLGRKFRKKYFNVKTRKINLFRSNMNIFDFKKSKFFRLNDKNFFFEKKVYKKEDIFKLSFNQLIKERNQGEFFFNLQSYKEHFNKKYLQGNKSIFKLKKKKLRLYKFSKKKVLFKNKYNKHKHKLRFKFKFKYKFNYNKRGKFYRKDKFYKLRYFRKNLVRRSNNFSKFFRHFVHKRERKSSFLFSLYNLRKRVFRKKKKRNYRRFYLNKIIAIKIFKVFYSFKYTFLKNLMMKIDTSYIYKNIFFNFIINLNFRLNILLKNFCFFYSLNEINQFIIHGYIYVNNSQITYPTYLLKETDIINLYFLFQKFPIYFFRFLQVLRNRRLFKYLPLYLEFDFKTFNLHLNKSLLYFYMCNMKPKLRYYFLRHFFFT